MGFFSWNTSDTNETIWNVYTGLHRPVYFLMPNGNHILEEEYDGYGVFGGVDAYEWLAKMNLVIGHDCKEFVREIGISLDIGTFCLDRETGKKWGYGEYKKYFDITPFPGHYGTIIPEIGMSPNEALRTGRFVEDKIAETLKYPIKFSFNKDAIYDDLPPATLAANQGFFIEDKED